MILAVVLVFVTLVVAGFLIHVVWLGSTYQESNPRQIAILMGFLVMLRINGNLLGMFWLSAGNAVFPTTLGWIQAAVKVSLGIVLVGKYGVTGVLAGSCIASALQVVATGISLHRKRYLNLRIAIDAVLAAGIVATIIRWAAQSTTVSLPAFVFGATATAIGWTAIWSWFAWERELKARTGTGALIVPSA